MTTPQEADQKHSIDLLVSTAKEMTPNELRQLLHFAGKMADQAEHPDGFSITNDSLFMLGGDVLFDLVETILTLKVKRGIADRQDLSDLALVTAIVGGKLATEWKTDKAWMHCDDENEQSPRPGQAA